MGISDDLKTASEELTNYIEIDAAVTAIAEANELSRSQVARWLLNRQADSYLPCWTLNKVSYVVHSARQESGLSGRQHYKAVYSQLESLIPHPQGSNFLNAMQSFTKWANSAGIRQEVLVWLKVDLDAFLKNYGASLDVEKGLVAIAQKPLIPPMTTDEIARILIMGKNEDESIKWWRAAAAAAKDRPWLEKARVTRGKGGRGATQPTFKIIDILTDMPETDLSSKRRWALFKTKCPSLYEHYRSYESDED